MSLKGRVAFITGAASGIGRAAALALGRDGAAIAAVDRNVGTLESVMAEFKQEGIQASSLQADISNSAAVEKATSEALAAFGHIDVLVHCAGIAPLGKTVLELSDDAWRTAIAVNLDSVFYLSRAVGRAMAERGSGTMIFISSDRGIYGGARMADYAAAKAGVITFVKSLALELASRGVTVNAINPGTTDTPLARGNMTEEQWQAKSRSDPMGRFSEPEEIAEIIKFLAVTAGNFMTGQLITTRMRAG